jgi:8-oxo-dGTP pyrophosphatase MutT (NUDIX family)
VGAPTAWGVMHIEQRASRTVYANDWMRVREDDIQRPDGSTGIYGVVEKDDFAVVIPHDGDGFWLVEQYRYPVRGRYWEFPQGAWDAGQSGTPDQLARTELREETGLRAGALVNIGFLYQAYGYAHQGAHVYVATDLTEGAPERSIEEQDMRVGRVSVAEFERMITDGTVRDASSVAAYALFRMWRGA